MINVYEKRDNTRAGHDLIIIYMRGCVYNSVQGHAYIHQCHVLLVYCRWAQIAKHLPGERLRHHKHTKFQGVRINEAYNNNNSNSSSNNNNIT